MTTVLDVTLRDGGNRCNFHFTDVDIQRIIVPLDCAGIEYIEVGYRNGALHPVEGIGVAGLCAAKYLRDCRALMKRAQMAVMAHPNNINLDDLYELRDCGVSLLRICVKRGGLSDALPVVLLAKQLGFMVSVNFIHASQYDSIALDDVVEQTSQANPDMIYFADSNGSFLPSRVQSLYEKYTKQYAIPFGFHAHDNLGLAQANTLAAVTGGAQYIDSALAGMGKGIGNLRTEFYLAYLQAARLKSYPLDKVLSAANYVRNVFHTEREGIDLDEFVRGISDLSTAEIKRINQL